MMRANLSKLWSLVAVVAMLAACSADEESTGTTSNGVNDVRVACELRSGWSRRITVTCVDCMALASAPWCECSNNKEFSGRCNPQRTAKTDEPECEGVDACVFACTAEDCDCVERCYDGKDVCRTRAAALDGCLAETCADECR